MIVFKYYLANLNGIKKEPEVLVPVRLWNASSVVLFEPIDVKIFGAMLSSGRARTYAK